MDGWIIKRNGMGRSDVIGVVWMGVTWMGVTWMALYLLPWATETSSLEGGETPREREREIKEGMVVQ